MSDISLKITVRNAHLLRAIRASHSTSADFCRAFGIQQSALSAILTFRASPFTQDGSLTAIAETICSALGKYPEELWPDHVASLKLKKASAEVEISAAEVMAICGGPEDRAIQRELLARWAADLTPREIEAIGMRQSGMTYEECGAALDVGKERVRQIEFRGYAKMRRAAARDGCKSVAEVMR